MALDFEPWERRRVGDLIGQGKLSVGDGYRAKNSEFGPSGLPFVRISNIDRGFRLEDCDLFPGENLHRVGEKISEPGDIVFSSKGTIGRFAFVNPDTPRFIYSPQICYWRSLDHSVLFPKYLLYWMQSGDFMRQVGEVQGQTDMAPYVNLSDQRRMSIAIPPLPEQRRIAHILGTLDDKIELNRQMNRTLEEIARTLFKAWFVDFEPVRAKAEGRDTGLPAEIAALFPSALVDSELGEIPEGWGVVPLQGVAEIKMGASPAGDTYNNEGHGTPLINGPVEFGERYPVRNKWTSQPTRLSQDGDMILCVRGSTTGRWITSDGIYCLGRGVCAIRAHAGYQTYVMYTIVSRMHDLLARTTGSVFPNLSFLDIASLPVLLPDSRLVGHYQSITTTLLDRVYLNFKQNLTLAELRDTLLPRLLSGELRVGAAEEMAGM